VESPNSFYFVKESAMSGKRFRAKDLKDLNAFQDILTITGSYLPLNFIMRLFNRMKQNPEDYDHLWLRNAILVTRDLCELYRISEDSRSVAYAATMLMETGRAYQGQHPHDASAAFALVFLNEEGDGFFDVDEIKMIHMCCRRMTFSGARLSVDSQVITLANTVRLMTDVLFPNPAKVVVEHVRLNALASDDPVSPDEWCEKLASDFAGLYGKKGSLWSNIPSFVLNEKPESVAKFQAVADNSMLISTLVKDNYNRIFGKR